MRARLKDAICPWLIAAGRVYLGFMLIWFVAYLIIGDSYSLIGLISMLAIFLFIPLPLVLLVAALCKKRDLWIGFAIGVLVFLGFWGRYYAPSHWPILQRSQTNNPTLTVMTYNVLATHAFTEPVISVIRSADPDIVFIQELNTIMAQALQTELADVYPYQVLEPADRPRGIGVISKYPIHPTGDQLPYRWVGGPILLSMDWNGEFVTLVNFHMSPSSHFTSPSILARRFQERDEQARLLVQFARLSGPIILAGDANTTPLNDAYQILTDNLTDAWAAKGLGLGHTFPGSDIPGSSRPRIGSRYAPMWLVRIDYIFHSDEWKTVSARLADIDGVSDHRGVLATLTLQR